MSGGETLERRSLAAADANPFFYSASRLHWPENMLAPSAPVAASLPAVLQQLTAALKARGISQTDVREAFGDELEMVGDWPAASRWPVLQVSLPVKDSVRARKIAEALTSVEISGTPWTRSEKNGATIYSAEPFGGFIPLRFGLAVADQMIIVGPGPAALAAATTASGAAAGQRRGLDQGLTPDRRQAHAGGVLSALSHGDRDRLDGGAAGRPEIVRLSTRTIH